MIRFVHLENPSMGCCTVLLCCEDENVAEELEGSVISAIKLLTHALEVPFLLAGAGATELFLADHLRTKASEVCTLKYSKLLLMHESHCL